jgi:hypothetical protein
VSPLDFGAQEDEEEEEDSAFPAVRGLLLQCVHLASKISHRSNLAGSLNICNLRAGKS